MRALRYQKGSRNELLDNTEIINKCACELPCDFVAFWGKLFQVSRVVRCFEDRAQHKGALFQSRKVNCWKYGYKFQWDLGDYLRSSSLRLQRAYSKLC